MKDKRKTREKKPLSFAIYVMGAFLLTSAMTVLITAAAIAIVWNVGYAGEPGDEELFFAVFTAGAIALLLSVILGIYFAVGIARPVQRISDTASAIKEGNLSARTGLSGDDQLGQLGQRFDEMTDAIERDRDLERQLIGDVAHELRTPLMAIQATVEAIQDGVFEADEEHLNTISFETRRLGRLVEALLHLNRLENGTAEVKRNPVNLSSVVSGLSTTHEALLETSGIMFFTDIAPNVMIIGDQDLISQAVANLLSNAVRYTPEGGHITVSVQKGDIMASIAVRDTPENGMVTVELARENGYAKISVRDTGVGISEEDMKKVFSRFWRADVARQSVDGGLGIGLALVKEVVDQHFGDVSVSSTLGEGSTFVMRIPLAPEDRVKPTPSARRSSSRRRQERAARKEQEKLRKIEERQLKARRKAREAGAGASATQELKLFGLHVPLPTTRQQEPQTRNKEDGTHE